MAVSRPACPARRPRASVLIVAQERRGLRAVVGAVVDGEDHVHDRPDGDDVALGRLATTGRLVIASMVRIATSGTLMIGIVRLEPNQPVLSMVNVLPP